MAIAGFCVIGLGFGTQGLVHAVSGEVLPRLWRSWGQAMALISTEVGLVLGLVVAGALNRTGDPDGFRNFYYITAALFFAASVLCIFAYNPPPTKQQLETVGSKFAKLDWIGYILLSSSLVLFSVALNWSENPYPWNDPHGHVAAPFALSMVLAICLIIYEVWKPDGLFHHELFQNRMFPICLVCVFAEGISFYAANVYVPYQASTLYETDFLFAPLRLAVGFMAAMVASVGTGLYCFMTKRVRWATFAALIIFVAFFGAMAGSIHVDDSGTATWGLPILVGWAFGMVLVTLVTAAQLCVPPALVTISSCLMLSVRALGGTVGFAIYQAVFESALSHLEDNITQAALGAGLPPASVPQFLAWQTSHNESSLLTIAGVNTTIVEAATVAMRSTYKSGFYNVWVTGAAFVSAAAIGESLYQMSPPTTYYILRLHMSKTF